MSSRLKILIWILLGLLFLYFGNKLTNQSRMQQQTRMQTNQQAAESKSGGVQGNLNNNQKAKGNYDKDLLKKSLGE